MYNRETVIKVKEEFEKKADRAKAEADARKAEVYAKCPSVREFDDALYSCYQRLIGLVLEEQADEDGSEIRKKIDMIRKDSTAIRQDRSECLVAHGFPADYTDIVYECEKCSDTGYVGIEMCSCMKKALIKKTSERSGLGSLLESQSFENFDLDYYANDPEAYAGMKMIYDYCAGYAESFCTGRTGNIIFIGGTGTGKTHLSTAIAKTVIESGNDVLYCTAIDMFTDFEHDRFDRRYNENEEPVSSKYFTCDLLIIDDLGTELTNQFTVSTLYNLINKRIIDGLPVIISTNLTMNSFMERYDERITSRLLGEFQPMVFRGNDIRRKKLLNENEKNQ